MFNARTNKCTVHNLYILQKLLSECEDWQRKEKDSQAYAWVQKHRLHTNTISSCFQGVYLSYWIGLGLEFQTQQKPSVLAVPLTVQFARDMHFSIQKLRGSDYFYGSSNQKIGSTLLLWTSVVMAEFTPKLFLYRKRHFNSLRLKLGDRGG